MMDYAPYRKPSSKWLPLTPDSFHHPSVHRSWPSALIRTFREHISGRKNKKCEALDLLVSELKTHRIEVQEKQKVHGTHEKHVLWITFPFNLVTSQTKLARVLRHAKIPGITLGIAWSKGYACLCDVVRVRAERA